MTADTGETPDRSRFLHIALVAVASIMVYAGTLAVQFVMDDAAIASIGQTGVLEHLLHGGPRRFTDMTFALNFMMHGLQPAGYHLVNLVIHLSASVTLYLLVVSALTAFQQSPPPGAPRANRVRFTERFVPLATALLFALHPVQTQAVTYIIQRYTSLATLLYLVSALFFIRARIAFAQSNRPASTLIPGSVTLGAAVVAMGSKQIAATLPVMLVILELLLFRGRLLNRRFFVVCGAVALLVLGVLLKTWHDHSLGYLLDSLHNATSENRTFSRTTYFLTQSRVVVTYLRLLCLPFNQSLFYDYPLYTSLFALPVITSLALHTSLLSLAWFLFRQSDRHLHNGDHLQGVLQRLTVLGIIWFYLTMSIESSLFPITDIIFEHRIYLPSAGFFLAVIAGATAALHGRRASPSTLWGLLAAVCVTFGGLTIARNNLWRDTMALWQDTVRKAPLKDLAQANLAGEYMKLNQPQTALPLFVRALELNPGFQTWANMYLGKTLQYLDMDVGRFTTGEELASYGKNELSREDRIKIECIMYNNLGLAYEYMGEPLKAHQAYRSALRVDPAYELAWYNLGLLSVQRGNNDQATEAMNRLKEIKPYLAGQLAAAMAQ